MARGNRTVRLTFGYFGFSAALLSLFSEKREANCVLRLLIALHKVLYIVVLPVPDKPNIMTA